jgi:putative membrane protein
MVLPALQPVFDWGIGLILVAVIGYMVVMSESPGWSLALFSASGLLGIFTLRYGYFCWHSYGGPGALLMPLLTGLFGISVLVTASRGKMPAQKFRGIFLDGGSVVKGSVLGTVAGIAVGWLPGLSNATANGVLASLIGYNRDRRAYILATSAANTANAFIGLAALFALGRMRSGVMVALSSLPLPPVSLLFAAGVVAACIAYAITVVLSRSAHRLGGIDTTWLHGAVILFVTGVTLFLTGPFGGLVLLLATLTGLVPHLVNIPRVFCMGAVMVPVMLYSFGFSWV